MNNSDNKIDFITSIVEIYKKNGLDDFEISIKDSKSSTINIKLSSGKLVQPIPHLGASQYNPTPMNSRSLEFENESQALPNDTEGMVYSEMVGTAYLGASPEAEAPFVKVGQIVSAGQTIMIIEAMKTMNHIEAPHSGTVEKILVEDGEPVQYNSELMIIR